jgi:hypothetical protein
MYSMTPPAVFVSDRVLRDEECMQRLNSFVKATRAPDWQLTYLVDDVSDVLVYEPELNLFSEMVRFFGWKVARRNVLAG